MDHVARDISDLRDVNDKILKKFQSPFFIAMGRIALGNHRGARLSCRDGLDRDRQSSVPASRARSGRQLCAAEAIRQAPVLASRVKVKILRKKIQSPFSIAMGRIAYGNQRGPRLSPVETGQRARTETGKQ